MAAVEPGNRLGLRREGIGDCAKVSCDHDSQLLRVDHLGLCDEHHAHAATGCARPFPGEHVPGGDAGRRHRRQFKRHDQELGDALTPRRVNYPGCRNVCYRTDWYLNAWYPLSCDPTDRKSPNSSRA